MGKKSKYNLVWMDCEMTGLDVEKEVIIEIATLITDSELNVLEEGPCIAIHQRNEILDKMDEWNTKHHNESGLVKRVQQSLIDEAEAEKRTLDFVKNIARKVLPPYVATRSIKTESFYINTCADCMNIFITEVLM
jgi:oligoribonuclease